MKKDSERKYRKKKNQKERIIKKEIVRESKRNREKQL